MIPSRPSTSFRTVLGFIYPIIYILIDSLLLFLFLACFHIRQAGSVSSRPTRQDRLPLALSSLANLPGVMKGKKYLRFASPWGQKHFTSVRAAIRAHALHHGLDPKEAAKPKPLAQKEFIRTEQRSVYSARASNGIVRYFVQLSYSSFVIRLPAFEA